MFGSLKSWLGGKPSRAGAAPTPAPAETPAASNDFLSRETIFDRHGRPGAHLFRLRGVAGRPDALRQRDFDRVLLDTLNASDEAWNRSLAIVPLRAASLDLPAVNRLKPENLLLLLHLEAGYSPNPQTLASLRERGVRIGFFRQPEHPDFAALMAGADCAAIDAASSDAVNLRDYSAAVRALRADPPALLACNLTNLDEHRLCHQWHYDYFHGNFAVDVPARPESAGDPHKMVLLDLLRLTQGDADNAEIVRAMKPDPLIGFRLLRYLNSPLLGLDQPIDSLNQALTLLGRKQLTRWLAVLLFSVREADFADWLMVESALTRGRMMELLGAELLPGQTDALFLTGIFSRIDRLLRRPLAEALQGIALAQPVRAALLERSGPYAGLLALAETAERFDPARIADSAAALGLMADQVNRALLAATAWTSEVTEHWT